MWSRHLPALLRNDSIADSLSVTCVRELGVVTVFWFDVNSWLFSNHADFALIFLNSRVVAVLQAGSRERGGRRRSWEGIFVHVILQHIWTSSERLEKHLLSVEWMFWTGLSDALNLNDSCFSLFVPVGSDFWMLLVLSCRIAPGANCCSRLTKSAAPSWENR